MERPSTTSSQRSMEILSPEPPKQLDISLSDSSSGDDSDFDTMRNKANFRRTSPTRTDSKPVRPSQKSRNTSKSKIGRQSRGSESSYRSRESTDLSTEESLLRTIERNLSAGRSSSKKNLQKEDFTSSLSKTETSENIEDNEEAENERHKKGMKKIEDNNLKLDDLHEHIKNIRAETEEIRRENAKMFHIYKEKLGRKGNQLLEKLYFKDYPSLEHIENAIKNEPLLAIKATGEYTDEEIFKMTDDQIDEIVKSKKFFQTELIDDNDGDNDRDDINDDDDIRSIADSLASTAITVGSKKSRNRPKNDIIKRNIQLAGTGDYLTPDERLRVEQILATIDEIESEESKSKNIGGDNQLIKMDPDAARLSRIDNLLAEKYSFSNKIEATNELSLVECKAELDRIDSRLSQIQQSSDDFRSSTLLAIKESEEGDQDRSLVPSKILPKEEISALISNYSNDLSRDDTPSLAQADLRKLLEEAKIELDL